MRAAGLSSALSFDDTFTARGDLVRLVVSGHEVVGAVTIAAPMPWVYRRSHLLVGDVE